MSILRVENNNKMIMKAFKEAFKKDENEELKIMYNEKIKRYYNGCQYIKEHIKDVEKWLPEVIKILDEMNLILEEIQLTENVSEEEILKGFKL